MAKSRKFIDALLRKKEKDNIEIPKEIDYIIYVRKSTDEKSWRQSQSIPDQIVACVNYANDRGFKIRKKPSNFEFETWEEIERENHDPDTRNVEIYKETRDLYIIKEQKSAKEPGNREKWKLLIKKITNWEIKWIISYSPNRQARNMFEWWELLNLVNKLWLSLKYTNFEFENSASWRMMLWFWFVFSAHYSEDLSETVNRGIGSSVWKGKGLTSKNKLWYIIENWFHKPYEPYFGYVKEAFRRKIYENATDKEITNYLKANWVKRIDILDNWGNKIINELDLTIQYINGVWKDCFYYWIHIYWKNQIDLRGVSPYFKPVITQDEYIALVKRYIKRTNYNSKKLWKENDDEIKPLPNWMVKKDDNILTCYIPNRSTRHMKKLNELKKENPEATLSDVVKPNQILFKCWNKKSKDYGFEISFEKIDCAIHEKLKTLKVNEVQYEKYFSYMKNNFKQQQKENLEDRKRLSLQLNSITWRRNNFIEKNLWNTRTESEEIVYKNTIKKLDDDISFFETEMQNIKIDENNNIKIFEDFVYALKNVHKYYENATYVQKRELCKIIFLNIMVTSQNQVIIKAKHWLDSIFSDDLWKSRLQW